MRTDKQEKFQTETIVGVRRRIFADRRILRRAARVLGQRARNAWDKFDEAELPRVALVASQSAARTSTRAAISA
jgi:hypothetical protein